jgi:hypothetical protein
MEKIKLAGKWKGVVDDLKESFYKSEMNLQDQKIYAANQKLKDQGYPVNLDDPLEFSYNKITGKSEPVYIPKSTNTSTQSEPIDKLTKEMIRQIEGMQIGTSSPVVNTYLQNKTPEQYSEDQQGQLETFGGILPAIGKRIGSRVFKFGNQFVDNVPGLSSIGTATGDKADDIAGAAIQAGGRVLPILGAAWYGINAGPTAAGTLDDARKKGLIK